MNNLSIKGVKLFITSARRDKKLAHKFSTLYFWCSQRQLLFPPHHSQLRRQDKQNTQILVVQQSIRCIEAFTILAHGSQPSVLSRTKRLRPSKFMGLPSRIASLEIACQPVEFSWFSTLVSSVLSRSQCGLTTNPLCYGADLKAFKTRCSTSCYDFA